MSRILLVSALLALAFPAAASAANYEIVGFSYYPQSSGRGINNSGQVVGSDLQQIGGQAFIYDGSIQTLGTLDGGPASFGHGINAQGWVAGFSDTGTSPFKTRAFFYDGTMHDIGTFPGGTVSYAYDLNNAGQVVGAATVSEAGPYVYHAFLYDGALHDLGTLGGNQSSAQDINNNGKVTGNADTADGYSLPFLWDGTSMIPLGTMNGTGMAINDLDQVVGYRNSQTTPSGTTAFIYDGGVMQDLGDFEGYITMPQDINIHGQFVGDAFKVTGESTAIYYDESLGIIDLNDLLPADSGWDLKSAWGINDRGQITGNGVYQGQTIGFLLSPVPEPGTYVLAAMGIAALLAVKRRQRQVSR